MTRPLFSLVVFLLGGVALAAPAPEPFVSGWGKPVDPDRDCKIRRDNGALTIEMPGTCHEYDPAHNRMNAPRLFREFYGDFIIQFQIRIACRPSRESTLVDHPSFVAGGLVLISPDGFTFKWHRLLKYRLAGPEVRADGSVIETQQIVQDADGDYHNYYDKTEAEERWRNGPLKSEPEHSYLRLERWGNLLSVHSSPDGKTWVGGGGAHAGLPPKLKVGLAAYTTSKEPSKVIFDQLKIIQGKKWEQWGFESGWGNPVDPDKDCKVARDKDSLTIEMPGTNHDYDAYRKRFNAPRLLSNLKGDFDVQVRVQIDSRPSAQSTVKGQPSFVSAGFLLVHPQLDDGTFCKRKEYAVARQGIRVEGFAPMLAEPRWNDPMPRTTEAECYAVQKRWASLRGRSEQVANICKQQAADGFLWDRGWQYWPLPEKADCAYLRLEQRDKWLNFSISSDGHKWVSLGLEKGLPPKGKLGLAAYTTSTEPSKVRFDQLKLARDKKKE
jgi:regulation of enolase protein 1 (concanavalin A-like superfamily)